MECALILRQRAAPFVAAGDYSAALAASTIAIAAPVARRLKASFGRRQIAALILIVWLKENMTSDTYAKVLAAPAFIYQSRRRSLMNALLTRPRYRAAGRCFRRDAGCLG